MLDAVAAVRNYVLSDSEIYGNSSKFVEGWGWDHTSWPGQRFPTAVCIGYLQHITRSPKFLLQADLDADPLIRGRPVVLEGKDGHAIWVSSRAMELSAPFPDSVEGGVIVRDSDGKPTGTNLNIDIITKQTDIFHKGSSSIMLRT